MLWLMKHLHVTAACDIKLVYLFAQVTLLQTHSAEHLILGAARRSLPYCNLILLGRTDKTLYWLHAFIFHYSVMH